MKNTIILLILFLCLPVWSATEVPKVVDPDNGGGTDYTSLDAYEDALGGTTSGHLPNDDQIAVAQCRSSSGTDDTATVIFNGWTTDSTRYIRVTGEEGVGDFPIDGIYDGTKYVLHNNDATVSFVSIDEDYVRFHKIQFLVTETSTNARRGIYVEAVGASNLIIIDSCIFKGTCSGTGEADGIRVNDADANINIYNTIVYGFISGGDIGFSGINIPNSTAVNIYNCTVYGNFNGINRTAGTVTAKNCAIGNNTNDINGTVTADYNCDDDNDGTNNQSPSGGNWTNEFITAGSDFALKSGGNCVDNGVADLFTEDDDIIDTARPQGAAWDIGAFELVVAAGVVIFRRRIEN